MCRANNRYILCSKMDKLEVILKQWITMSPYLNLNTFAHVLVLVRDGFSVSGILFSLQRKQEVVLAFALLLLNLDLTAPEGITQGRKLRLTCWSNVNAVIVLKQNDTNTFIWWRTWILRCSRKNLWKEKKWKLCFSELGSYQIAEFRQETEWAFQINNDETR